MRNTYNCDYLQHSTFHFNLIDFQLRQISFPKFAFFTVKSPSVTQRSVSQENAFKKSKNSFLLPFFFLFLFSLSSLLSFLSFFLFPLFLFLFPLFFFPFPFFSSPFSSSLFFSLSSLFLAPFFFSLAFKISPENFPRVGESPTSPTPGYATA